MKNQIAFCMGKWALPVLVDENGNVFYSVSHGLNLPFVTTETYQLIDGSTLLNMTTKVIIAEKRIEVLKKQIDENYSPEYLQKYFSEKVVDLSNFDLINKVVVKYKEFLHLTVMGKNVWYDRWAAIKAQDIEHIDKELAYTNLFMEFIKL